MLTDFAVLLALTFSSVGGIDFAVAWWELFYCEYFLYESNTFCFTDNFLISSLTILSVDLFSSLDLESSFRCFYY